MFLSHHTRRLFHLFIVSILFQSPTAGASDTPYIERALQQQPWLEREWRNLLHIDDNGKARSSRIDDDTFFYTSGDARNARTELLATLKQLFVDTDDDNRQTQCRFPARSKWLIERLSIDRDDIPKVSCEAFETWRQRVAADHVTMIFPAYHLNSPSSMFGHTLLRLDNISGDQSSWLAYAVNFGADVDPDDNSILYAYRGLAGGYPGSFVIEPYFRKIQDYNRIEHRDIWEYSLNLNQIETLRMIDHLWEIKDIHFDYYFFDENCSYRLLELLEVARPDVELTDGFSLTAIPVDTVRAIDQAGLIEAVHYRPAQVTELRFRLDALTPTARDQVYRLARQTDAIGEKPFRQMPPEEQRQIVALAYDYLRYLKTRESRDPETARRRFLLLNELNRYPVDHQPLRPPRPVAPEHSHHSRRISLGTGKRLDNAYLDLGFKFSFHDLEDNPKGFLQGAQINIGQLELRAVENTGLRLHRLNLVDIFSLTPRNRFFNPLSWKVYSGFERQLTENQDVLVYHLTGGAGGSWEVTGNHQVYALLTTRLEINRQLRNSVEPAIGFNTGLLAHFQASTLHLSASGEQFEDDIYRLRVRWTQNFPLSVNHSIRIRLGQQWQNAGRHFTDIRFSYQYYFY